MRSISLAQQITAILLTAALLAGCGTVIKTAPPPVPTLVLDNSGQAGAASQDAGPSQNTLTGSVTASGNLAPAQSATLASTQGGNIQYLQVKMGDHVEEGEVLVRLAGSERLAAAVEAANLELLSARQALMDLQDNASQERAKAMLRVATAKDNLDDATKRRGWKNYRPGDDNQIAVAQADLIVAEDTLKKTEDAYGGYADSPEDNLNKAAALSALSAARKARDKAVANLNYLLALPDALEVEKADAVLEIARAELEAAQREYTALQNGPDPQAVSLAEARIKNASAQLTASQAALSDLELKAPFSGTVSMVSASKGEWIMPGQAILTLADLDHLRVETTDLSERDVPLVHTGQAVTVQIKALNIDINGRVSQVSPLADTLGGDVVYTTIVELDNIPPDLRAGMSVEVQFGQ